MSRTLPDGCGPGRFHGRQPRPPDGRVSCFGTVAGMDESDIALLARRLAAGEWVPSAEELALGRALVLRSSRLEQELQPAGMPLVLGTDALWLTQVLAGQCALVREVGEELLPVWRERLRGSAMLGLVEAYIEALRPLAPFARRLQDAWERRPPF